MGTVNSDSLVTLKMLLGIEDNEQDSLLSFLIEDTENLILGYCRLEIMPRQLESLIPVIAADMYRAKGYGNIAVPSDIKSISQGERSVNIETKRPDDESILKNYFKRLKPFRNVKGRVPSDIG